MELKIYTDGGSINNPGPSAISFLVYKNSKPLKQFSTKIGINTNNFAEYKALMSAMEWVRENIKEDYSKIIVFSDSNLMVNQLNGLYKVKNTVIRDFIIKIRVLEQEINKPVFYQYIPREKNWLADSLVKKALQNF